MENITPEQKLKQMLDDGIITDIEYRELLAAMKQTPDGSEKCSSEITENIYKQKLKQMLDNGNITKNEYLELLVAIKYSSDTYENYISTGTPKNPFECKVPWQIWVVVVMLAMEGLSNLFMIPDQPMALIWLIAKCVFIAGLIKGWKWVYCLFIIFAGIHVLLFLPVSPAASLINLILILLVLWPRHYYFPPKADMTPENCIN